MFQRSAVLFRLPCTLTARGNGAGSAITATAARSFKSTAYINVNGALKMQQNTSRRTFMTSPLRMNVSDTSAAPITPISQGEAAGREQCAYLLASNQRDPENRATGTVGKPFMWCLDIFVSIDVLFLERFQKSEYDGAALRCLCSCIF